MHQHPCKAPFCDGFIKYTKSKYCSYHQIERQTLGIKAYKEILPLWSIKRCKLHGYLRPSQCIKRLGKNQYICKLCQKSHRQPSFKKSQKTYERNKDRHLIRRYGITLKDYNKILNKQNNACAICKKHILNYDSKTGLLRKMATDHCHENNIVRGILCFKCNIGLGSFQDDITILQNAIDYLRPYKEAQ